MEGKEKFENLCNLFINSVNKYFTHLTEINSDLKVPYLKDYDGLALKGYTGMIGISGSKNGFVYISANREMFEDLINMFIGLEDPTDEDILDMAGEISNVVAGSIRTSLDSDFVISVPTVFEGKPKELQIPKKVTMYVIPLKWNQHEAFIVVGID